MGATHDGSAGTAAADAGRGSSLMAGQPFPIVGVGASAGGVEALEHFFSGQLAPPVIPAALD